MIWGVIMSRQEKLLNIIQTMYHTSTVRPDCSVLYHSQWDDELWNIYIQLGGVEERYPVNVGRYDVFATNFAVELDEERHFNRYRAITLNSNIYVQLPLFPTTHYEKLCCDFEIKCLRAAGWGGNWSSPSTDRQFGPASISQNFQGKGSSRWKQRAYYDFLKDVLQLTSQIPLARISIYDEVNTSDGVLTVNDILTNNTYMNYAKEILKLIESRC